MRELWTGGEFREERYAATALLDTPGARAVRAPELLPLYRELIVSGAWWDHVDELAHRVGELRSRWPETITPQLLEWAVADDIWLRRAVDHLPARCGPRHRPRRCSRRRSTPTRPTREFFLRKAIGWALRDYARTDPGWVRTFVAARELSPLSRREALKHLGHGASNASSAP